MSTQLVLFGLVCLLLIRIVQAELHARRLRSLVNDLATMIGELFDVIGGEK